MADRVKSANKFMSEIGWKNNSDGQGEAFRITTTPRNNIRLSLGELATCLQCGFAPVRVDAPCNGAVQFCFICPNVDCQSDHICPENYRWCLSKKQAQIVWNRDNEKLYPPRNES